MTSAPLTRFSMRAPRPSRLLERILVGWFMSSPAPTVSRSRAYRSTTPAQSRAIAARRSANKQARRSRRANRGAS